MHNNAMNPNSRVMARLLYHEGRRLLGKMGSHLYKGAAAVGGGFGAYTANRYIRKGINKATNRFYKPLDNQLGFGSYSGNRRTGHVKRKLLFKRKKRFKRYRKY